MFLDICYVVCNSPILVLIQPLLNMCIFLWYVVLWFYSRNGISASYLACHWYLCSFVLHGKCLCVSMYFGRSYCSLSHVHYCLSFLLELWGKIWHRFARELIILTVETKRYPYHIHAELIQIKTIPYATRLANATSAYLNWNVFCFKWISFSQLTTVITRDIVLQFSPAVWHSVLC